MHREQANIRLHNSAAIKKFFFFPNPNPYHRPAGREGAPCGAYKSREQITSYYSSDDTMADVPMSVEEERQDDEKNRCVNKLVDICLSLTEQVIRLKEMIEASSMVRRRAAAMPPLPPYSCMAALVEPFVREIRRRQEQEQEQEEEEKRIDDVEESDSEEDSPVNLAKNLTGPRTNCNRRFFGFNLFIRSL